MRSNLMCKSTDKIKKCTYIICKDHSKLISEQGLTDTENEIVHIKGF